MTTTYRYYDKFFGTEYATEITETESGYEYTDWVRERSGRTEYWRAFDSGVYTAAQYQEWLEAISGMIAAAKSRA